MESPETYNQICGQCGHRYGDHSIVDYCPLGKEVDGQWADTKFVKKDLVKEVDELRLKLHAQTILKDELASALKNAVETNKAIIGGSRVVNLDEAIAYWESMITKAEES